MAKIFEIPKTVMGLGGPIKVSFVKNLKHKKEKVAGLWLAIPRTIQIRPSEDERDTLHTYFHELAHAAIYDSGQHNLLTEQGEEALCDLIAMSRLRELGL